MRKFRIWIFIAAVVAIVLGFIFFSGPISRTSDTPQMRELSAIYQLCTKLRYYADEHSVFPSGVTKNNSIDELVAAGVLSADDAAYIRDHRIEYRGFDLNHIAADVPVFETIFTNTSSPRRIVGFSDGHVTMQDLRKTP